MPIRRAIQENLLVPYFQPIVAVNEGRVVAYEALIRGPLHLNLRDPAELFGAAEREGLLRELERECWSTIVQEVSRNLDRIPRWTRIFLNVLPEDIRDADFLSHVIVQMEETRLDPARIVIEITETTRIEDYGSFNTALSNFRQLGFGVAVDDAGAGHAGLQMITEINPDFLKIDQSLVRGIDQSIAKRAGVEALLLLARSLGMTVIAEGIESEDELHALHRLGVSLGQGFLLAHPTLEMAAGVKSIPYQLKLSPWTTLDLELHGARGRIGNIAVPSPILAPDCSMRELMALFDLRRTSDGIVLVEEGVPVGLVMRAKLNQELSRPFAGDRIESRLAAQIGADRPIVVDCEAQLDAVARLVTARGEAERYDDVIVVRDGKLVGTVSVARLLHAVTDDRLGSAIHANPLTGLSGRPVIEELLREKMKEQERVALVHFDIDSLKSFNQLYGFHQGDRAIRLAADLIESEIALRTSGRGQLNHIGGDDFIAVLTVDIAESLTTVLPRIFRERVMQLYHPEDRARGYLMRRGNSGEISRAPLMQLTVVHVEAIAGVHQHYAELLDLLTASLKSVRAAAKPEARNKTREVRISA